MTVDYDGKFKIIVRNSLGEAISAAQITVKRSMSLICICQLKIYETFDVYFSFSQCPTSDTHKEN